MSKKGFFLQFWLIFYPLDPGIRIFLRIRIQEAKILRIQRIRILSTVYKYVFVNCYNMYLFASVNNFTFGDFLFLIYLSVAIVYVRVLRFGGWFDQFTCSYLPSSSSNSPLLSLQGLFINMQISWPLNIILRNAIFFPKLVLKICQKANLK